MNKINSNPALKAIDNRLTILSIRLGALQDEARNTGADVAANVATISAQIETIRGIRDEVKLAIIHA